MLRETNNQQKVNESQKKPMIKAHFLGEKLGVLISKGRVKGLEGGKVTEVNSLIIKKGKMNPKKGKGFNYGTVIVGPDRKTYVGQDRSKSMISSSSIDPLSLNASESEDAVPPVGLDWWTEEQSSKIRLALGTKKFKRITK